jgi:hypothetical protein
MPNTSLINGSIFHGVLSSTADQPRAEVTMKPIIAVGGLFLAITFALAQRPSTQAQTPPPSYPLVCRGGGNLHFNYTPFSNLSPDPQIWITFDHAAAGVGADWQNLDVLQPGQCGWLDRAVAQGEPNQIAVLGVQRFAIQWQRGQVTGISSELTYINTLQNPNQYQSFQVTNNGKGFFIVTKIGESRNTTEERQLRRN